MIKLLVFGSRSINDDAFINEMLNKIIGDRKDIIIIEGDAIGVDRTAGNHAKMKGLEVKLYKPDWNKLGKAAGILCSEDMVKECTKAIGFWNGVSNGTRATIKFLEQYKKHYILFIKKEKGTWIKKIH